MIFRFLRRKSKRKGARIDKPRAQSSERRRNRTPATLGELIKEQMEASQRRHRRHQPVDEEFEEISDYG